MWRGPDWGFVTDLDASDHGTSSAKVIVAIRRLDDAAVIVGAPGIEIQRRGRPFVSHDALDHVHGDAIVDQPGGVGMSEIMETWAGSAGFGDVQDGFTCGHDGAEVLQLLPDAAAGCLARSNPPPLGSGGRRGRGRRESHRSDRLPPQQYQRARGNPG